MNKTNVGNALPASAPDPGTVQPAMPESKATEAYPPMNLPTDPPIGIDRGESPMEKLPETISVAELAKKGGKGEPR